MNEVLEFINRRFKSDCNWLNGNCYYFAVILKDRFPLGNLYYDIIYGHFIFKYEDYYYDWTGKVNQKGKLVKWDEFEKYDRLQKACIVRDCIQ